MNTATAFKTGMEFARSATRDGVERNGVALRKDELLSWDGDQGLTIEAREGTVWLTQTGNAGDVILSEGDTFQVNRPGRVVVQSLGPLARLMLR
jgi:hypothetical protein